MAVPDHPLDNGRLGILVEEVGLHAAAAEEAFRRLDSALQDEQTRQSRQVWIELQAFFTHAGMVSKFVDPPRNSEIATWRATQICKAIKLDSESPIFDRRARNFLEHIDERLDLWARPTKFAPLLEIVFESRAEALYLDARWFWRRILILDEMVFGYSKKDGRKETPLLPLAEAVSVIRQAASEFVVTVFPEGEPEYPEPELQDLRFLG